jgi:predicted RNA-binding Zn-ribbon protein involved in translation (DUF1610 family)
MTEPRPRVKPSMGTTVVSHACPRCNSAKDVIYTRPSIKYGNVYFCQPCDEGGPTPDKPNRSDGHFYVGKNGVKTERWW